MMKGVKRNRLPNRVNEDETFMASLAVARDNTINEGFNCFYIRCQPFNPAFVYSLILINNNNNIHLPLAGKHSWPHATRQHRNMQQTKIYSNKKETSDFYGTVSFDPVQMSQ